MRQSEWFAGWRNNDKAEKKGNCHEGRRSTGNRGRAPGLWRRGASEGRRRGSLESWAKREVGPLSHGLF